jgi:hypothetical protein
MSVADAAGVTMTIRECGISAACTFLSARTHHPPRSLTPDDPPHRD